MIDKYKMPKDLSIFLAKRNIVDIIYKSALLENISVTYPETHLLYEGGEVNGLKVNDVVAINNLKHAWKFLFDNLDYDRIDLKFACHINGIVGSNLIYNAGHIRKLPVTIGGYTYIPDIPNIDRINEKLSDISKINVSTDRALELMLFLMRTQIFMDGNKRTSMLYANKILIENGNGYIDLKDGNTIKEFTKLLVKFYETNKSTEIKDFLYKECIYGIDLKDPEIEKAKNLNKKHISQGIDDFCL